MTGGRGPEWGQLTGAFRPSPSALVCRSALVGGLGVSRFVPASHLGASSPLQALGPPSSTQVLRSGRELGGREFWPALSPWAPLGPPRSQPFQWASPGLLSGRVWPEGEDLSLGLGGQIRPPTATVLGADVQLGASREGPGLGAAEGGAR